MRPQKSQTERNKTSHDLFIAIKNHTILMKKDCGFSVFSLNNEGRELNAHRIEKFGLHRCFDGFISSSDMGMRKPDPRIYQLATRIAQRKAEECAYFDDRLMLVNIAKTHGIQSFHHENFTATKEILVKLKNK